MERGVVIRAESAAERSRAVSMAIVVSRSWNPPWPLTMFCAGPVPWDLAEFAFALASRWGIVAPFDRSGRLATQVGDDADRAATEVVVGDLRQPLYSPELVVVGPAGLAALATWRLECRGGDERLAFLRAIHSTPCRVYAAPRAWLQSPQERARMVQ